MTDGCREPAGKALTSSEVPGRWENEGPWAAHGPSLDYYSSTNASLPALRTAADFVLLVRGAGVDAISAVHPIVSCAVLGVQPVGTESSEEVVRAIEVYQSVVTRPTPQDIVATG